MYYLIMIPIVFIYFFLGIGAAIAEAQARNEKGLDRMTIFLWPLALIVWAYYGEV